MPIRKRVQQLGKNAIVYSIGNILTKLSAFFLIPIYTRYLTKADVGVIALIEMFEFFLVTILPLGIVNAIWRFIPGASQNEKAKIISSSFWGLNTIGLIIILGLLTLHTNIAAHLDLGTGGEHYLIILLINVFLFSGGQFILWIFQYDQKPIYYLIVSLFQFIAVLVLNIHFVVYLRTGVAGVLYSKTIVFIVLYLFSAIYILRTSRVLPSLTVLKKLLKYSIPFIVIGFITPVLTISDRYFLNLFVSLEQIGVYSIAYKFGMLINIALVLPMQRTLTPMIYKTGLGIESQRIYRDILFYFTFIGSVIVILLTIFAKQILLLFTTPEYFEGAYIIPWVALAYLFNGFRTYFRAGIALGNRTSILSIIGVIIILINIVLNYFLIKFYGVDGALISTITSYLIFSIVLYFASQRIFPVDWGWQRLLKLLVITATTVIIQLWLSEMAIISNILNSIIVIIFFILTALVSGIIGSREIIGLMTVLKIIKEKF